MDGQSPSGFKAFTGYPKSEYCGMTCNTGSNSGGTTGGTTGGGDNSNNLGGGDNVTNNQQVAATTFDPNQEVKSLADAIDKSNDFDEFMQLLGNNFWIIFVWFNFW